MSGESDRRAAIGSGKTRSRISRFVSKPENVSENRTRRLVFQTNPECIRKQRGRDNVVTPSRIRSAAYGRNQKQILRFATLRSE